jgi:uncharacterized protein (DUF302 family)
MSDASTLREIISDYGFSETVARLTQAIEHAGMDVFVCFDHAAKAAEVGLDMPATVVITYGNASNGTPVMLAAPSAALELPLRALVRAVGEEVHVSFRPIAAALEELGVAGELARKLEPAQQLLIHAVTSH